MLIFLLRLTIRLNLGGFVFDKESTEKSGLIRRLRILFAYPGFSDCSNILKRSFTNKKINKEFTVPLKKNALFENTHEKLFCHSFY